LGGVRVSIVSEAPSLPLSFLSPFFPSPHGEGVEGGRGIKSPRRGREAGKMPEGRKEAGFGVIL